MTASFALRGYIGGVGMIGGGPPTSILTEEFVVVEGKARIRVYRTGPRIDGQRLSCVLCVHGSAFYGGRFDDDPLLLPRATQDNIIVLCDHRGSMDGGTFPNALHDVASCVRFVRANAEQLGIDDDRIAVFGDSSGAWMATMLAVLSANPKPALLGTLGDYPDESASVSCAVALSPPIKFDLMDQHHDSKFHAQIHDAPDSPESHFMGFPVQSRPVDHASPISYATPKVPPIFLAHGDSDPLVPCGQSRLFYEHLAQIALKPAHHQYHEIVGAGHGTHHFSDPAFAQLIFDFLDTFNEPYPPPPHRRGRTKFNRPEKCR